MKFTRVVKSHVMQILAILVLTLSTYYFYVGVPLKLTLNLRKGQTPEILADDNNKCKTVRYSNTEDSNVCQIEELRYLPFHGNYRKYLNYHVLCELPNSIQELINGTDELHNDEFALHSKLNVNKQLGFLVAVVFSNENALEWTFAQVIKLIEYLGPENVFLTVLDKSYNIKVRAKVNEFREILHDMGLGNYHIILSNDIEPDLHKLDAEMFDFNDMMEPFYHFFMDKDSMPYGTDHIYMSDPQWNKLIENRRPNSISKVVLIKNQYFCAQHVLELILQSYLQEADITSGIDVNGNKLPNIVDAWNYRDIKGQFFNVTATSWDTPTQVMCSFSGLAVYNATAFTRDGIRMRRGANIYKINSIKPGECSCAIPMTLCFDFIKRGYNKHVVLPLVKSAHSKSVFLGLNHTRYQQDEQIIYKPITNTFICEPMYEESRVKQEDVYNETIF